MRTRIVLPVLVGLALLGGIAVANPLGDEARLLDTESTKSLYATGAVFNPATNRYLAVYRDSELSPDAEVHVRQVGVDGAPAGTPAQVSSIAGSGASEAGIAFNGDDQEALVFWTSPDHGTEIHGHVVDGAGQPKGADFRISNAGTDDDFLNTNYPDAVWNPDANEYLVVFAQEVQNDTDIFYQRLDRNGNELGGDVRITQSGATDSDSLRATRPRVVYNETSDQYLVAYYRNHGLDSNDGLNLEVHLQRLTSAGAQVGTDDARLTITGTDTDDRQSYDARMDVNPVNGEYLIAWESDRLPLADDKNEVWAQRLEADADPIGVAAQVTTTPGGANVKAFDPDVAFAGSGASGQFAIVWERYDLGDRDVYGQRLAQDGTLLGSAFPVARAAADGLNSWIPNVAGRPNATEWLAEYSSNCRPNRTNQIFVRRLHPGAAAAPGTCPPPPPGPQDPPSGGGGGPTPPGGGSNPPGGAGPAPAGPAVLAPAPRPAAAAPSLTAASVLALPSARRCVSRRRLRITLRQPPGAKLASAAVTVDGRPKTTVRGARLGAPVDLTGLPAGSFTVRVTVRATDGRTATVTRKYRTCAKKKVRRKR